MRKTYLFFLVGLIAISKLRAQDTLPRFSLNRINDDKVLIQWRNLDTSLRQLTVQQSHDSLTGFRSILTIPDPRLVQNGTVISRPLAGKMYYRIYLLYPRGRYLFSASKSPSPLPPPAPRSAQLDNSDRPIPGKTQIIRNFSPDSLKTGTLPRRESNALNDSTQSMLDRLLGIDTKDQSTDAADKKSKEPSSNTKKFIPSKWVYTLRDGYPFIQLPPEWDLSEVQIRFFQENGEPLFELNRPPIRTFRIDKTNFHHAGWFLFEIWVAGEKKETNRFFLPLEL